MERFKIIPSDIQNLLLNGELATVMRGEERSDAESPSKRGLNSVFEEAGG
jgi:hypothetical protein